MLHQKLPIQGLEIPQSGIKSSNGSKQPIHVQPASHDQPAIGLRGDPSLGAGVTKGKDAGAPKNLKDGQNTAQNSGGKPGSNPVQQPVLAISQKVDQKTAQQPSKNLPPPPAPKDLNPTKQTEPSPVQNSYPQKQPPPPQNPQGGHQGGLPPPPPPQPTAKTTEPRWFCTSTSPLRQFQQTNNHKNQPPPATATHYLSPQNQPSASPSSASYWKKSLEDLGCLRLHLLHLPGEASHVRIGSYRLLIITC
jgi:hypothetical protein